MDPGPTPDRYDDRPWPQVRPRTAPKPIKPRGLFLLWGDFPATLVLEVPMGNPTPKEPIVLNDDGSISMLIYQGRTFRLNMTHEGLTYPPTDYKCRFAITTKYGETLLASADSEDGDITFSDATLLAPPEVGTVISVVISDEDMDNLVAKGGKLDCVLEDPTGHEDSITVGDWILWRKVSE